METVIAYYSREDGDFDRYEMPHIDFTEARERFPEMWSLEVPIGGKIHDKAPPRLNVQTQLETQSQAPVASSDHETADGARPQQLTHREIA